MISLITILAVAGIWFKLYEYLLCLKSNSLTVVSYILSFLGRLLGLFVGHQKIFKVLITAKTIVLDEKQCHFWILHL